MSKENQSKGSGFLMAFLIPTLIGKVLILYFGSMYSAHPDEGYGYGLLAAVMFTVTSLSLFIWQNRNYKD